MRRFLLPGLVATAAVALLVLLAFGVGGQNPASSLDAQVAKGTYPVAPDLNLRLPILSSSAQTDLAAFRGKVVVVNMFASWCVACASEAPVLAAAQPYLKAHGATLLGVDWQDNPSASAQFARQRGIAYPVIRDVNGDLARSFGTYLVPETFILNRQSRVVALRRYQLTSQTWLRANVAKALGQPS